MAFKKIDQAEMAATRTEKTRAQSELNPLGLPSAPVPVVATSFAGLTFWQAQRKLILYLLIGHVIGFLPALFIGMVTLASSLVVALPALIIGVLVLGWKVGDLTGLFTGAGPAGAAVALFGFTLVLGVVYGVVLAVANVL